MNKVFISGRLTKHPELRYTTSGKAVAVFSMAVNRRGKDQPADFISCIVWEKLAEVCDKYLDKGSKVLLEGRIQTRNYQDKNGNKHYITEVLVSDIEFMDSKNNAGANAAPSQKQSFCTTPMDEEILF